ncbi:phosphate ABC transporter permease PstA [Candidatus Mycoplasma mahonii]|uniref:phosphate ABC transporter permease PstA n=1 Tax=Candidatus Mycoplasma mahonii TaxID=3004105 RepID=UPI0026ECE793|nr:phosphate ABC transporter permease PstA [Candidatus Mycoplasma mahonii]WKX02444.1 phosphate ABC transporter permease PstA [Candidatus Mycoplasma mahonii]
MQNKKLTKNFLGRLLIFITALFSVVALVTMVLFIFVQSIPAYKEYGFFHMYFTSDFTPEGGFGIWSGLLITLISSVLAVIIAYPLSIRVAIFMRFRMKNNKWLRMMINISAGIPSVIFGIFALKSLSGVTDLLGADGARTLLNAILMLSIMLFPTMISLLYNQLLLINKDELDGAIALGNSKTTSIYKVVKKGLGQQSAIVIIVALGRAIGETMALSIILTAPSSLNGFNDVFPQFLNMPFATLGVEISRMMFLDGATELTRSALFAAGLIMLLVIIILISVITKIFSKKKVVIKSPFYIENIFPTNCNTKLAWIKAIIKLLFLPLRCLLYSYNYIFQKFRVYLQPSRILYGRRNNMEYHKYFLQNKKLKRSQIPDMIKLFWESIALFFVVGSIGWIVLSTLVYGLPEWKSDDWKFQYQNVQGQVVGGSIMNPLVWTILLTAISIIITFPFALGTAIFLSEYAGNKRYANIVRFFLATLGGTPSILFGIFGSLFFLKALGLSSIPGGTSLIAGSLTMMLVILPTFTNAIEQVFSKVGNSLREASYALGATKWETIWKVVLPGSIRGISTGIVLSSGRVIAETAPLYLTLGMFNGIDVGFLNAGHTLTTDILFYQVYASGNADELLNNSYKLASVAIILVGIITMISETLNKTKKIRKGRWKWKKEEIFSKLKI